MIVVRTAEWAEQVLSVGSMRWPGYQMRRPCDAGATAAVATSAA